MSDEVVWQIINQGFCSFKTKTETRTMCRNKYNVSGECLRSACPLANGRYATILERKGVCYLYMKTAERAHTPKNLWEKVRLPAGLEEAKAMVNEELKYWPKYLLKKNTMRLRRIHEYLARMRRFALKPEKTVERVHKKVERREAVRESKALRAANLDVSIEKELLDRLRKGHYEDIYNFPQKDYEKVLDQEEVSDKDEESELEYEGEFVEGLDEEDDIEDVGDSYGPDEGDDEDDANEYIDSQSDGDDVEGESGSDSAIEGSSGEEDITVSGMKRGRSSDAKTNVSAKRHRGPQRAGRKRVEIEYEREGARVEDAQEW
eukprot:Rmarinus@m.14638